MVLRHRDCVIQLTLVWRESGILWGGQDLFDSGHMWNMGVFDKYKPILELCKVSIR